MKDFSSLIESYSGFLSEKSNSKKETLQGSIVSFSTDIEDFDFESRLNLLLKSSENSLYLSSRENDLTFIALDSVLNINENGPARFTSTDKKIKGLSGKYISNDKNSYPLFVGAMKFTVEHSDDDWKDFNDSNWFIPEFMICRTREKAFLVYNYFVEQGLSRSKLAEKFSKKLDSVFNTDKPASASDARITNSDGLSPKDKKKWKQIINQALEKIQEGEINKIVLSRKVDIVLSGEMNLTESLDKLRKDYPKCCVFAFHKGGSTFFGATPELLAKVQNQKIEIDAIAGSIKRSESNDEDSKLESDLLKSEKNLNEHNYVLNHLKDVLKNISKNISFDNQPSIRKLKNIQHLSTKISAELKEDISLMNVLKELHPTPAVCGYPKEQALNLIKKIENQKRGLYSGIIGWFNHNNEGEFAVSIRSAVTKGNKLSAYAGGGIVEGSEPDSEFEETEMKFKPILSLFDDKKN